jgi:hypothetical protein
MMEGVLISLYRQIAIINRLSALTSPTALGFGGNKDQSEQRLFSIWISSLVRSKSDRTLLALHPRFCRVGRKANLLLIICSIDTRAFSQNEVSSATHHNMPRFDWCSHNRVTAINLSLGQAPLRWALGVIETGANKKKSLKAQAESSKEPTGFE